MGLKGSIGRGAGALVIAVLLGCGSGPGLAALAADDIYLDTTAMMLFPADIDEAGLGETCVSRQPMYLAERAEQEDMRTFLRFDRVPQAEDDIEDLVDDGDMVSITSLTSNQDCEYIDGDAEGEYFTIQSSVLVQERRRGARDLFDLVADESLYLGDMDTAEWAFLDAPDLGDEADIDVRWSLDDGERDSFTDVVLTVRVDRLVGQVRLTSNGTRDGDPDIESVLEAGEVMAGRMEEGLEARRMPANTLLRLVDQDDDDGTVLTGFNPEYYQVFNGIMTPNGQTTASDLEIGRESIEQRGSVTRFSRDYVYDMDGEIAGVVQLRYYQYQDAEMARADLDTRLDAITGANPDSEIEQLDLEWGDGALALMLASENDQGDTEIGYHGFLLVDDEMAHVQVVSFADETDVEVFEFLMEYQESCMESRTGCDGPLDVREVFG